MNSPFFAFGKKGSCAAWHGQDQQQCSPEGHTDSSCKIAELSNLPSYDTSTSA